MQPARAAAAVLLALVLVPVPWLPEAAAKHEPLACPQSVATPEDGTVVLARHGWTATSASSYGSSAWWCGYDARPEDGIFSVTTGWYEEAPTGGRDACESAGTRHSSAEGAHTYSATHMAVVGTNAREGRDSFFDAAWGVAQELLRQAEAQALACGTAPHEEASSGGLTCPPGFVQDDHPFALRRQSAVGLAQRPWEREWECLYGQEGVKGEPLITFHGLWNQRRDGADDACLSFEDNGNGMVHSRLRQARVTYGSNDAADDAPLYATALRLLTQLEFLALACPALATDPFRDLSTEEYETGGCAPVEGSDLDSAARAATVASLSGDAQVANGKGWTRAREGDVLLVRGGVRVGHASLLRLEFFDDRRSDGGGEATVVDVRGPAMLCIEDLVISEAAAGKLRRTGGVELIKGLLKVLTRNWKNGGIFAVNTVHTGSGGVRGSEAVFQVWPEAGAMTMMLREGEGSLFLDGEERPLRPGTAVTVVEGVVQPEEPLDEALYGRLFAIPGTDTATDAAAPSSAKPLPGPPGSVVAVAAVICAVLVDAAFLHARRRGGR